MSQGSKNGDKKQAAKSKNSGREDLPATEAAPTAEEAAPENAGAAAEPTFEENTASSRQEEATQAADEAVFKPLADEADGTAPRDLDMIMDIPVTLSVELGSTRLSIRELLDLAKGSIVELDGLAGEPMEVLINGYLVAHGEVVVVEDKYGIRITDIVNREDRIRKLNR